jgi:hypothetical protein
VARALTLMLIELLPPASVPYNRQTAAAQLEIVSDCYEQQRCTAVLLNVQRESAQ